MKTIYWTTKTGEKIDIDKMSLSHLRNVLKMIVKNNNKINNTCPHNIQQAQELEPYCDDWMWK